MAGIKAKSHYSGHVAAYNPASEHAFDEQYHTFNAHGYALDPNTSAIECFRLGGIAEDGICHLSPALDS